MHVLDAPGAALLVGAGAGGGGPGGGARRLPSSSSSIKPGVPGGGAGAQASPMDGLPIGAAPGGLPVTGTSPHLQTPAAIQLGGQRREGASCGAGGGAAVPGI